MVQTSKALPHRPAAFWCAVVCVASLWGGPARSADTPALALELNKLEPQGKACRVYLVVDNSSDAAFQALKVDLVVFRTDGVIDRRLLIDLAPVRAAKKSVKIFDLDALTCDAVGSVLVNDVTECRDATGPVLDCADRLKLSSRAGPSLTK